ncbi:hypothetical protein [Bilophila wadsworthia]
MSKLSCRWRRSYRAAHQPGAADGKLTPVVAVEIRKEYLHDFR